MSYFLVPHIKRLGANATLLRIGRLRILQSYDTLVAADDTTIWGSARRLGGLSVTSKKHCTQNGFGPTSLDVTHAELQEFITATLMAEFQDAMTKRLEGE